MLDSIGYALLDKLSKTDFWKWFVKNFMTGLTTRIYGYPQFPMEDFFKIVDLMKPDCLYAFACSDYKSIGSSSIRAVSNSLFTHAGVILNAKDRDTKVIHMRSDGLNREHMLALLREVDYFAVIEIPLVGKQALDVVKSRIESTWMRRKDLVYDFEERLGNDQNKLYCSEYVLTLCGDLCVTKPKTMTVLGREVFAPDNILDIGKVVYSNHNGIVKKYIRNS
jgi:hypothetical protein